MERREEGWQEGGGRKGGREGGREGVGGGWRNVEHINIHVLVLACGITQD